jgi:hypothetical protein
MPTKLSEEGDLVSDHKIANDSATHAGLSCPSISIVLVVKRIRPGYFLETINR